MKKFLKRFLVIIVVLYAGACTYMYFMQEKFIFNPTKLENTDALNYSGSFKEMSFQTQDGIVLSGVLKTVEDSKGLIFYLHGNRGNLNDQVSASEFYADLGFDFFSMDYRSFGKSSGELINEEQFFSDVELVYDSIKKMYDESTIRIIGYSVGTGSAAMLASINNPKSLTLMAPYYSLVQMTTNRYKIIPTFLLKYPFETNKYVSKVECPVEIIHGTADEVLPFSGSVELSKLLKPSDVFIQIEGQGHNGFEDNQEFVDAMKSFLN